MSSVNAEPPSDDNQEAQAAVERYLEDPIGFWKEGMSHEEIADTVEPEPVKHQPRKVVKKPVWITPFRGALALGAAVLIAGGASLYGGEETRVTSTPIPQVQQVEGFEFVSSVEETYEAFSPWSMSDLVDGNQLPVNQNGVVWLSPDGDLESSAYEIDPSVVRWVVSDPFFVTNATSEDGLVVMTINNREFTVYNGQPFVYASHPEMVYLYSPETGRFLGQDTNTVLGS